MLNEKIISEHINAVWSDYCDLDYWIDDMTSGRPLQIPKNVLKMAMKHLRNDMHSVHNLLCEIHDNGYIGEGPSLDEKSD